MAKWFRREKQSPPHPDGPPSCPGCGCALSDPHWSRCPRCLREIEDGGGCGGCGACNG